MQQKQEKKGLPIKKSFSEKNLFMLTCLSISCQPKMMSLTFYVTSYCCRSLAKSNRCDSCKEITIAGVEYLAPEAESNIPINAINFFNDINCGGLSKPTKEMFDVGMLCWGAFAELSVEELKKRFLSSADQRSVFKEIVNIAFFESGVVSPWSVPTART